MPISTSTLMVTRANPFDDRQPSLTLLQHMTASSQRRKTLEVKSLAGIKSLVPGLNHREIILYDDGTQANACMHACMHACIHPIHVLSNIRRTLSMRSRLNVRQFLSIQARWACLLIRARGGSHKRKGGLCGRTQWKNFVTLSDFA